MITLFTNIMPYDFYLRQIIHGNTKPLHIDLHKAPITLSGNKYSELKQYSKVSHPHATIESKDGQWYVQDLNSFYGTFVNGFHIGKNRHPLQIGDQIALGSAENGFICALSVTPLKIKEEPVELVDISDDPPSIKSEPKDDYEISGLPPIKTTCIVLDTESEISLCNKFKFDFKKSIKTEPPDDCSHSSLSIFTNAKNISSKKNSVENFAKTNHDSVKIISDLVEHQKKLNPSNFPAVLNLHANSTNTINSYSLHSKDTFNAINHQKLTNHVECVNSTKNSLKSQPYNQKKLSIAKKVSSSRKCIDLHLSSKGHQHIDSDDKYYNKSVNLFAKEYKVSGRKRAHVNSVQDEKWSPCEVNSSNNENLIGVNATEISELVVSKSEDWCKTAKRKRLFLDPKIDTFKKTSESFLRKCDNSAVYSSDLSALVKDNSCISSSVEDNFETIAMDIVDYSQNKMVFTNPNPKINNNLENVPPRSIDNFCQVIRDNQVLDMSILDSDEGMCPDFLSQISSIPEENKICTNFLAPLVSASQQKFIAKPRADDVFDANEIEDPWMVSTSVPETMSQTTPISSTSQVSLISTSMLKSIISSINQNSSILSSVHNAFSNFEVLCNQNTVMPIINSNLTIDSDIALQETSGNKSLETKTSSVEPTRTSDVLHDSKWLNKWIPVSPTNNCFSSDSLIENERMSGTTSASVLKYEPAIMTTIINQPLFSDPSLLKHDNGLFQGVDIFNSDECTSVVSEDSKSLNIGIPVSLKEDKTSHAMSYVASTAILKSEAPVVSPTTNPLLQSGPHVLGTNDGISQGKNIPMPDEYISQGKKWINNWVPVPPIEEQTSCINRLSMMGHNLDMASTPILKCVSEEPVASTSEGFSLVSDLQLQLKKINKLYETNASKYIEIPAVMSAMHDSKWLKDSTHVSSTKDRISSINNLSLKDYNSDNDSLSFCEFASETSPDTPLFVTSRRTNKHVTKTKESDFLVNKVPSNKNSSEISYVTVSESVLQTTSMLSMSKQISMDNCNASPSYTYADCIVRIPSPTTNIATPITPKANKLPDKGEVRNVVSPNQQSSSQDKNAYSKQTRLVLIKNLVECDVNCLTEMKNEVQPPFLKLNSVAYLPLHFSSFDHYASSFVPLLMLEVWKNLQMESKPIWENNIFNLFYFRVLSFQSNSYMDEFHCEALVNELSFPPTKGSAVIMKIKAQNNTYYNGCCYIYKHSIEKLERDLLNSQWEKIGDENLKNSKLWKFSVFVKPQTNPPVLNELMRGNGICSVQKYLRLADGLEYLKSSSLCKNILEPKPNVFCEPSKSTLKLTYSEALAAISTEILESPSEPKIVLLQGAPGTGKTQVIVNLIKKLIAEDSQSKILVTAPTDANLDVIGHRLIASKHGNFFIRLGQTDNVDKHIIPFCLNTKADLKHKKNFKNQIKLFSFLRKSQSKTWHAKKKLFLEQCNSEDWVNSSQLKCKIEVFQNARIVLSTLDDCTYLKLLSFTEHGSSSIFSCCIMDDVTRCPELEVLQSLIVGANKLLLIGDLQQVPPEGFSSLAVSYGFNRSMFQRFRNYLSHQQRKELVLELKEQFRMHSEIWHFPSTKFYSNSSLIMHYPNSQSSEIFQQPYCVYDILGTEFNVVYDQVIFRICLRLRTIKKTAASIGIIIPSKSLRSYYMEHILKNDAAYNHIEIDTVDAFRGREKDVIILSCDNSKLSDNSSFLYCRRAMTVALTRARKCLIICMCSNTIKHIANWQNLIADAKARTHYKKLSCVKAIHSAIQKIVINKEPVFSRVMDRPVMRGGPHLQWAHRNEE